MTDRPLPTPTGDSLTYWEGCRDGRLRLQRCADCGEHQSYPRVVCTRCMSDRLAWRDSTGKGRVFTYTVVERALSPAFEADVPYIVAVVELEEGVRMMTRLVNIPPPSVAIGIPVRVSFLKLSDTISLPVFEPDPDGGRR
jgi:uncharacterized OB-fold protein